MDAVTIGYKAAATLARYLPRSVVEGVVPAAFRLWALKPSERRSMVRNHQRRVEPRLSEAALDRQVRRVYGSYGRYYAESFRLPSVSRRELDSRMTVDGYEHMEKALAGDVGPIAILPHLGSWEWCAYWFARVKAAKVTAVVERLEPPSLFEWFASFRREMGIEVVALGPDATATVTRALHQNHVLALLSDRDVAGGGVPVEFFGEQTTLPGGAATLALRMGAPLLPVACYDRPGGGHHAVVKPPIPAERLGTLRQDVARITQNVAGALEDLVRVAPHQWHLMQPNWPSDRTPVRL